MNITPPFIRQPRRLLGVAVALVAAVSLTIGVAFASAANGRKHVILSFSPAKPVAGQPFTVTYTLVQNGVELPLGSGSCLGMTNRKPIALSSSSNGATVSSCTWNIPANAGPTFDGMVAFKDANGGQWYGGYDLSVTH
jgi:hypothetical protein